MSEILMQKSHKKRKESRESIFITEKIEFISLEGVASVNSCLKEAFGRLVCGAHSHKRYL